MNIKAQLCDSPDIFQEKIKELFNDLKYNETHNDNLLIIINSNYENHLNKLLKDCCKESESS